MMLSQLPPLAPYILTFIVPGIAMFIVAAIGLNLLNRRMRKRRRQ